MKVIACIRYQLTHPVISPVQVWLNLSYQGVFFSLCWHIKRMLEDFYSHWRNISHLKLLWIFSTAYGPTPIWNHWGLVTNSRIYAGKIEHLELEYAVIIYDFWVYIVRKVGVANTVFYTNSYFYVLILDQYSSNLK